MLYKILALEVNVRSKEFSIFDKAVDKAFQGNVPLLK